MRASTQWCYLEVLRTFGFAHDKDKTPGPGDLAWFCVACPQPGVNLLLDWYKQANQSVFHSFLRVYVLPDFIQVEVHASASYGWKFQSRPYQNEMS